MRKQGCNSASFRIKVGLIVGILLSLFTSTASLQTASEKNLYSSRRVADEEGDEQSRKAPQFRAEVDQVVLYASIYDRNDQLLSGLQKEEFTVYENRVRQEITYFRQEDIPSTTGIIMDSSGSMRNKAQLVHEATQLFLSLTNPQNQLFLIDFDDEVRLEENFTHDREDIRDALDNLIISGGTALYDAIHLGVDKAQNGSEPRKTLIVFTDGEDRDSYYRHEELLEKIREADVQLHIVAFLDPALAARRGFFGIFKSQRERIIKTINGIAEYTGGKAFFPEKISQLKEAFQTIAHELRNQYRLAYISSNPVKDGNWRDINLVVQGAKERGLKVRAKKGYFAK